MRTLTWLPALVVALASLAGCGAADEDDAPARGALVQDDPAAEDIGVTLQDAFPESFDSLWQPWEGDLDGMVERRVLRVVAPYGGYQFYYDNGLPRGAVYELVQRLESWINSELKRKNLRVYVVVVPVSRDQLLPALLNGHADLVAGDLTITDERAQEVDFSRPLLTGINEVVVTGPITPPVATRDDLADLEIVVRRSSSYYEHLRPVEDEFRQRGLTPPRISTVDEILEAEDILEMLNAGMIAATVLDDYKAEFWAGAFADIEIRDDLAIHQGGKIAWAMRKDSPQLMKTVNAFLRKNGRGTLIGNDTYNRYLEDPLRVRCAHSGRAYEKLSEFVDVFQRYAGEYGFDWLMLAAQSFQESGLRHDRRSPAGAIGIMQVKPSTAADPNVGIDDISSVETNVHAGTKYLRFLTDRYFGDDDIEELDRWFFGLAAYNAGPAKIARYRREAEKKGYDPDVWFDNVEIIAARRIGRETVTYVSNIYKYYVGYQLALERGAERNARYGDVLTECRADDGET